MVARNNLYQILQMMKEVRMKRNKRNKSQNAYHNTMNKENILRKKSLKILILIRAGKVKRRNKIVQMVIIQKFKMCLIRNLVQKANKNCRRHSKKTKIFLFSLNKSTTKRKKYCRSLITSVNALIKIRVYVFNIIIL